MELGLKDKLVVVTGAAGTLGGQIARAFAAEGAHVAAADFDVGKGGRLVEDLKRSGASAEFLQLDVTDSAAVRAAFDRLAAGHGSVDVLVNCAGITLRHEPLEFPEADFDRIIDVNLKGPFLCSQAAARRMIERGGRIVNIASIGGVAGLPNTVAYCSSKGGLVNMTRALAIDLAKYRINVNAVAPALANTPIAGQVFKEKTTLAWFMAKIPLGRLCEPSDVANAVLFLSSDAASFITGQVLAVDGGWLAG